MRISTLMAILALALSAGVAAAQTPGTALPKAQISSATGKVAPGFTLNDENGRPFRLADLRGKKVVLFFYRGYW